MIVSCMRLIGSILELMKLNKSTVEYQKGYRDGFNHALNLIIGFADTKINNFNEVYCWFNDEDEI